jgi:O-antigen biosynthesis protein
VDERFPAASRCDTCSGSDLEQWLMRSDGLAVLQCGTCGAGVVERPPPDLDELYTGDYYETDDAEGRGYGDYSYTAEHSVGWVGPLVELLAPTATSALDIGCADGLLLTRLPASFTRRTGIEVHPAMVQRCRERGIEVLSTDVFDEAALLPERGAFDVVTAMAVFEHVTSFRRAVEVALAALAPRGLLLFEVPLLVEAGDEGDSNHAWLTSSLEHLHYPTRRSLRHLFEDVLGVPLGGGELLIPGYGSTFVGLSGSDPDVVSAAGELWRRVRAAPSADLSTRERRVRAHLHVLHAARSSNDDVRCLSDLVPADVNEHALTRLAEVWQLDVDRRDYSSGASDELRAHLSEVESYTSELVVLRDQLRAELRQARAEAESQQRRAQEALAQASSWEQRAHTIYADTQLLLSSTSWRLTAPLRRGVTAARQARSELESLRPHVNGRRVRATASLVRSGDLRTVAQRVRAVRDTAALSSGLDLRDAPTGPRVPVQNEPWPEDQPLVSVVIPCFNYGAYVREAVASVLAQTLSRVEVIVVDGGSTDGTTPAVLLELAQERPEITVLFREGRHLVGDNRNYGIERARGRYVCCLDADDLLAPIYLEVAAYLLEQHGYDLVSTASRTFGLREETFGLVPRPDLADMLLANNVSTVAVFRRELWETCGGFHDVGLGTDYVYEDWKLWVRMAARGARIINIVGQPLFRYRVHGSTSLSNQSTNQEMASHRRAVVEFNAGVVDDDAHALSRRRRDEVHVVTDGLVNLVPLAPATVTVLLVMPFLIVGGADRLLSQVAEHLAGREVRVVIVTTVPVDDSFGDTSDWFATATNEIYQLPKLLDPSRWIDFLDYLMTSKHIDVIWLAGSAFLYRQLPRLRRLHPALRVVDQLWNTVGHTADNRRYAESIDVTLVENEEVRQWLLRQGELPDRVRLVESGVDVRRLRPREPSGTGQTLRVGFSGRFSDEKDPLAVLDIASSLRDRDDVRFVMTGAGPLLEKVRARRDALGIEDRVEILGVVDDVGAHLAGLDVLLLPSRLDGRPVVALEALACGVPVVASAVGGLPALLVDEQTGFLCRPGRTEDFVACIRRLADDRDLLDRMRQHTRYYAEEHLDVSAMCRAYEQVLVGELLAARSEQPAASVAGGGYAG